MNIEKLFQMQKVLDDRMNYNESDRLEKKAVALLVEVSEWANENRWFKFWSKDKTPQTRVVKVPTMMDEDKVYHDLQLEEYVDGFHFVLSLGLEPEVDRDTAFFKGRKCKSLTVQFIRLNQATTDFWESPSEYNYIRLFELYFGLGEMLGYSWEQIEQAYCIKNQINHQRQESGVY